MVALSDGMIENLIAEAIGIIATAILFSWIGRKLAERSASRSFDARWATYRKNLAASVELAQTNLQDKIVSLAQRISEISEKPREQINRVDFENFRRDVQELRAVFDSLESFISKHHFALRENDIAQAQALVATTAKLRTNILDGQNLTLGNFESMLRSHLDGSYSFDTKLPPQFFNGTRHEFMVATGKAAAQKLKAYTTDFLEHGIALAACLKVS